MVGPVTQALKVEKALPEEVERLMLVVWPGNPWIEDAMKASDYEPYRILGIIMRWNLLKYIKKFNVQVTEYSQSPQSTDSTPT